MGIRPQLGLFLLVATASAGCVDFNVQCTPDVSNPNGETGYLGTPTNLQPVSLLKLVVRSGDHPIGQLLAESYYHAYDQLDSGSPKLPTIAVENSGSIRSDCRTSLNPGLVLRGWLRQIIPFDDVIYSFPISFTGIQRAFEHSVFFMHAAGAPPNVNPSSGFLQVYGAKIDVDCSKPAEQLDASGNLVVPGQRVRVIHIMSRTDPTTEQCAIDYTGAGVPNPCTGNQLWVGANDYLYGGGDGYTSFQDVSTSPQDADKLSSGLTNFNTASAYWEATYGNAKTPFPGDAAQRYVFQNCSLP